MAAKEWKDEYYQMIDDCEKRDKRLSAWEADFLESIRQRLDDNKTLTPKQLSVLEGIWEKATSKG